ncbi:MAG: alpha/beta hydrolase [Candidimonas sp.]|nr:MAG: alpha/beta hydrolase [Candidimonas sp.]TAM25156.1 MAG: alpha/beta hydrolase [Candidimonas sp.]
MEMDSVSTTLCIDPAFEVQYNLRVRHPERTAIYRDYASRSARTRRRPEAKLDLKYGVKTSSVLDLFVPEGDTAPPLLIFIHGGYWRALDKRGFSFIADAYLSHGVAVAIPNYALRPSAALDEIVAEACDSVSWLAGQGRNLGYDDSRIVISGHSAGAHMAAWAIDRERMPVLAGKLLGYVGLSGLFDLEPLLSTSINHDLRLTGQEARKLSLYDDAALFNVPLLFAVGEQETQGFRRQSLDFSQFCKQNGHGVENMVVPRRNHFNLLADFIASDTANSLFDKTLAMFQIWADRPNLPGEA